MEIKIVFNDVSIAHIYTRHNYKNICSVIHISVCLLRSGSATVPMRGISPTGVRKMMVSGGKFVYVICALVLVACESSDGPTPERLTYEERERQKQAAANQPTSTPPQDNTLPAEDTEKPTPGQGTIPVSPPWSGYRLGEDETDNEASNQLSPTIDEARGWDELTLKHWNNLVKFHYIRQSSYTQVSMVIIDFADCPTGKAMAIDTATGQVRYDSQYCLTPTSTLMTGSDLADRAVQYRLNLCHCSLFEGRHGLNFLNWCKALETSFWANDPVKAGWDGQDENYCKDMDDDGIVTLDEETQFDGGVVITSTNPNYLMANGKPFRFWQRLSYTE